MSRSIRRKDSHKFHKLGMKVKAKRKWRKAKGRDNKIREGKRGHAMRPKIGEHVFDYVRPITIENLNQLQKMKDGGMKTEQEIVIAGRVGGKKRAMMIEKAKTLGIKIINPRMEKEK